MTNKMNKKKIYLAIPFSKIEELSFKCANEVASLLIAEGHYVFSPISHSYPIWKTEMVPHTYEVWLTLDKVFVDWAEEIWVVNILGVNGMELISSSKGVQQEIAWATEQNKEVKIINYNPETKQLE
jgi:hypothetical protein